MNKSTSMKNTIVIYTLINTLSSEVRFFYLKKNSSRNIYNPGAVENNMGAKIYLRAYTYISFNKQFFADFNRQ